MRSYLIRVLSNFQFSGIIFEGDLIARKHEFIQVHENAVRF